MAARLFIPVWLILFSFFIGAARAQNAMLGMNASMGSLPVEQQNILLSELHAAGVRYIRAGIAPDDKGIDLVRRAQAQGIGILWLVQLQYRADAPSRSPDAPRPKM